LIRFDKRGTGMSDPVRRSEPRDPHLQMLEAIAGDELLERSYQAALERGYLWHEFGDSHLILP
jgi:S-adenosylmethionine:tRNA-ribosyltransferase-isomerase (queuine synthetase)